MQEALRAPVHRNVRLAVCRSERWKIRTAVAVNFTVTKVTPSHHRPQYDSSHELFVANVMTRLWRNSVEAAAAVGAIVLATMVVHLVMSWWSASAALH
jgi:hypothetical protein